MSTSADGDWYQDNSGDVNVKRVSCNANNNGQAPIPNRNFNASSPDDLQWVRETLNFTRTPEPQLKSSVPAGATNLAFMNLVFFQSQIGIHLKGGANNPVVFEPDDSSGGGDGNGCVSNCSPASALIPVIYRAVGELLP